MRSVGWTNWNDARRSAMKTSQHSGARIGHSTSVRTQCTGVQPLFFDLVEWNFPPRAITAKLPLPAHRLTASCAPWDEARPPLRRCLLRALRISFPHPQLQEVADISAGQILRQTALFDVAPPVAGAKSSVSDAHRASYFRALNTWEETCSHEPPIPRMVMSLSFGLFDTGAKLREETKEMGKSGWAVSVSDRHCFV